MQSLNTLIQQGKVLYLGISDTPAWVVVKANCYAREHACAGSQSIRGDSLLKRGISNAILSQCALMKEWQSMLGVSTAMVCDGLLLLSAWP